MSVVFAVLFSVLTGGVRVWERVRCGSISEQEVSLAFEQMRRGLRLYLAFDPIPFKGNQDEVSFPARILRSTSAGQEYFEPGRKGFYFDRRSKTLCRSEDLYRGLRRKRVRDACSPLIENVESLKFRYYAYDAKNKSFGWSGSWKSEGPPLAVQAEVNYHDSCSLKTNKKTVLISIPQGPIG